MSGGDPWPVLDIPGEFWTKCLKALLVTEHTTDLARLRQGLVKMDLDVYSYWLYWIRTARTFFLELLQWVNPSLLPFLEMVEVFIVDRGIWIGS